MKWSIDDVNRVLLIVNILLMALILSLLVVLNKNVLVIGQVVQEWQLEPDLVIQEGISE